MIVSWQKPIYKLREYLIHHILRLFFRSRTHSISNLSFNKSISQIDCNFDTSTI